MNEHGLGRVPHPETPLARAAYPVTAHPDYTASTRRYRYWWEGGAWLNQGSFGTCVGNAFAHRIADAPVRRLGIDEDWARKLYLDASGDTTYQQGTSGLLACRVLAERGTISNYYWLVSPDELRNALLEVGPLCIGIEWFNSMDKPKLLYNHAYMRVNPDSGLRGGHEVVLNGINLAPAAGPPFVRMKNSWGKGWPADSMGLSSIGGPGTARFAMADIDELLFGPGRNNDAVLITEVRPT